MSTPVYNHLCDPDISWHCTSCGLPNFASSLFESTIIDDSEHQTGLSDSNTSANSTLPSIIGPPAASSSPNISGPLPKPSLAPNLRMLVINCCSIRNKRVELWNIIESVKPSILVLIETWLNPTISSHEILRPELEYEVFRRDRPDGYGGVAICLGEGVWCVAICRGEGVEGKLLHTAKDSEAIFVQLELNNKESLIIGGVYCPPKSNDKYMADLCKSIKDKHKKSFVWVAGDFNLPDIDWTDTSVRSHHYPQVWNLAPVKTTHLTCS